jgi:hypothetical protein
MSLREKLEGLREEVPIRLIYFGCLAVAIFSLTMYFELGSRGDGVVGTIPNSDIRFYRHGDTTQVLFPNGYTAGYVGKIIDVSILKYDGVDETMVGDLMPPGSQEDDLADVQTTLFVGNGRRNFLLAGHDSSEIAGADPDDGVVTIVRNVGDQRIIICFLNLQTGEPMPSGFQGPSYFHNDACSY